MAEQVREYQARLAPEIRRTMKAAILGLPHGDTRALSDELDGLYRLRVGSHRVIFRHRAGRIECFLAAPRSLVYEYLAAHLHEYLG